ncbi:MAG: hypothetical protein IT372_13415 [Polyangiaceae bacterium]|nr:hypothetical protein [Polyangiaceae bacterium]
MGYREERDALQARAEGLEQELAETRGQLDRAQQELQRSADPRARIDQLERDLMAAQRALGDLRAQIDRTPRRRSPGRTLALVLGATSMALGVAGAAAMLRVRAPAAPPVSVQPGPPMPPPPRPAPPNVERGPVPVQEPARPAIQREARWAATVKAAQGFPVGAGSACEVKATLSGGGQEIDVVDVEARCGDRVLYRSTDELHGMSMLSSSATERASDKRGALRYTLAYNDTGERAGMKAQISLRTESREARVWRTNVPSFQVDLKIDELSAPVVGPALAGGAVESDPLSTRR